ncbi:MAG: hypothetical protein PHI36_03495 [Bacteroidales bacterium]|nr:hypothetical protein [Bacteroidales bacterium]
MTFPKNKYFFIFPIAILILLVFFPSLNGQFLNWDDTLYISMNKLMNNQISFNSFLSLYDFDNNISLVLFSFLVQIKIFGYDPFSFHLFNIIIHTFNAILIYKITLIFLKNPNYALLVALLFSLHPMKVESVAWIIQRKDLMFSFFFLCSILLYIKYIFSNRMVNLILIILFGYLATLCKIQAMVLPFSLLLIEYTLTKKLKIRNILFALVLLMTMLTKIQNIPAVFVIIIIPILLNNYWSVFCSKYPKIIDFFRVKMAPIFNLSVFNNTKIRIILNIGFAFSVILLTIYTAKTALFNISDDAVLIKKVSNVDIWITSTITLMFFSFIIYSLIYLNNKHSNQRKLFGINLLNTIVRINRKLKDKFLKKDITGFLILILYFILLFSLSHDNKNIILLSAIGIILLIIDKYNKSFLRFDFKAVTFILPILTIISLFIYVAFNYPIFSEENNFTTRFFYTSYSLNYYLIKFIFPINLSAMHPYPDLSNNIATTYWFHPIISLIIISSGILAINKLRKSELKSHIIFGLLFFLINISLVLHIIPIKGRVIVADRYTYMAYFGLTFALIVIIKHFITNFPNLKKLRITIIGVIATVICVISFQSFTRSKLWKDDKSFWSDVIKKDLSNHYAFYSLGLHYYENKNYLEAINNYSVAIDNHKENYEYFTNRGACFVQTKNDSLALLDFEMAIRLNDKDYASCFNRGVLYFNTGDLEKSKIDVQRALNIKPDYPLATSKLNQINELLKSIENYNKNTTQSNYLSDYYNKIGVDFAMNNRMVKALNSFNLAIKYDTTNIRAFQNRGNTYASLKEFENAKIDLFHTIKMAPNEGEPYFNLANILHETGDVKTACEYWKKALSLGVNDAQIMLNRFCGNN